MRSSKIERRLLLAAFVTAGLASLWMLHEVGDRYLGSFALELGASRFMSRGYAYFLVFWSVFGALAALCFAAAYATAGEEHRVQKLIGRLADTSDLSAVIALGLIGFLIPFLIRSQVLLDADIADDESAYRFMSELLLSGRLYAESPPMKLFFDRAFMINDGRLYAQYFLGWPALLAPGMAIGLPGLMNPLYSALTIPPLFLALRRLGGRLCAVVGTAVFLSAPLLQFAAATQLSHTSCFFALTWAFYFAVRIHDGDAKWWLHAALATAFSIAFFIRPSPAMGVGGPLLLLWLASVAKLDSDERWRALAAFAGPAIAFGAVFLAVNAMQNGSPTYVSYQRAVDYARENGFRFSAWDSFPEDRKIGFGFGALDVAAARTGVTWTRFNFALFGWPLAFVFLPFAGWRARKSWVAWSMLIGFVVVHAYLRDGGIDTIGPVHYSEAALPVILLTVLGVSRLTSWFRDARAAVLVGPSGPRAPLALCLGLITASVLGYVPIRAAALHDVGLITGLPIRAAEVSFDQPTLIFAPRPVIPRNCGRTRNYVYWRPNNDPELENRILWVNHITVAHDRKLAELFPDRQAFAMGWSAKCLPVFMPLDEIEDADFPRNLIMGTGKVPPPEEMR